MAADSDAPSRRLAARTTALTLAHADPDHPGRSQADARHDAVLSRAERYLTFLLADEPGASDKGAEPAKL